MNHSVLWRTARSSLLVGLTLSTLAFAAASPKVGPSSAPRIAGKKGPAISIKFRVQQLHLDNNEGCAVADFNRDGKLDVSAGEFWYAGPDFKAKHQHRKLEPFGRDYMTNCGEHAFDVNGDGFPDIVTGSFMDPKIYWYENPGTAGINSGARWNQHVLIDTGLTRNESSHFHDLDGDGTPEYIIVVDLTGDGRNDFIWGHGHNYGLYWEERRDDNKDGSTNWRHHLIDDKNSQNHCLVWEDIDNDGKPDLITGRRVRAHSGNDPGDNEPGCLYFYKWNAADRTFAKHLIAENGPGTGLQIRLADLDHNGWKDVVVAGKSGTHVIWNDGK